MQTRAENMKNVQQKRLEEAIAIQEKIKRVKEKNKKP